MKRKLLTVTALVLALITVMGTFSSCTKLSSAKKEKETVLYAGDFEVPFEIFRYLSLNYKKDFPSLSENELKEKVEESITDFYSVISAADDYGLSPDDDYYKELEDRAVQSAVEEAGGEAEYKKKLSENFMNDSVFRFLTTKDNIKNELYYAMVREKAIDDSDENIKRAAESDEFICVKQILIRSESSNASGDFYYSRGEEHSDGEAEKKASQLREKALAGEDFDSLVRDFGESLYMMQNSDGYWVCRGMWEKENEDAVFSLDVGEISPVIKSSAGYSVFMRCEKDPSRIPALLDTLRENYCASLFALATDEKRGEIKIRYTDEYKDISILALKAQD